MFFALLAVTFGIALLACFVVTQLFRRPLDRIFERIIGDEISAAWVRYILFAAYVVGISGGVRVWELERYITPQPAPRPVADSAAEVAEAAPLVLNAGRWTLEVYRTLIGTLQSIAWMLLIVFIFALIAYVIVRAVELRRGGRPPGDPT
ncbi:MAG: hypothetical protein PVF43_11365 [Candidatus Eiseniibacteriota bacterium]|jgi:hypothetical protein